MIVLAKARRFGFRKVLAPSHCYTAVWGDISTAMVLSHGDDWASESARVRDAARNANAHANFRLISLVSASSVCLRNIEAGDLVSANVNEHGHDGCGSWLKLAEHRMKPYSGLLWPDSIER